MEDKGHLQAKIDAFISQALDKLQVTENHYLQILHQRYKHSLNFGLVHESGIH